MSTINSSSAMNNIEVSISSKEYNDIFSIQQEILNMITEQCTTEEILAMICTLAEKLLPNSVASIMLLDKKTGLMSVKSAPSVPQVGHNALENLKPGPHGGSCGNAVFRNEAQYVQNTFEDERWNNLRQIAVDFNLCSCWSMPIRDKDNKAIGSFALSSFEHRNPSDFHKRLLEISSSIVRIVLKNQHIEKKMKLFNSAIENASEGMIITDKDNNVIDTNNAFENIYGYTKEEIISHNPKFLASGIHDGTFYKDMWNNLQKKDKWSGEVVNKKKDGTLITQWSSITCYYDDKGNLQNYLAVFTDLTELKEAQKKVEHMAYHDSLTNLFNKAYFEKLTSDNKKRSVILLNIDNFSYINTAYGFDFGDNLLKNIAKTLSNNFNVSKIFRFYSDEFALVFNDKIELSDKIHEIQKYFLTNSITIDKLKLNISFSYGAIYGNKNLLRNTSSALKSAKENGKNRYFIFDEKEDEHNYSKKETFIQSTNLVREAIENDKVIPYFQGIYNNKRKRISKYEALVRIEKDDKIISPYLFLEAAKLSGLLPQITRIMIDKTFKVMSKSTVNFSINITEDDLSQSYLLEYLHNKMKEYQIMPCRITLEILEGVSSTGKKNHIKQINAIKSSGIRIAIDDFGTEYSNFERILDLDVDFIKIDAKYIKDIHTNKRSYEITKALVFFAKNVNISCIAEFVHNKEVQEIVDSLGIEYSQGYYFSEPKSHLIS